MNELDFTQSVAVIRVYEKKLLPKQSFDRMVDSPSYDDAFKILFELGYSNRTNSLKYEEVLKKDLKEAYDSVRKICPEKEVVDFISLKYDYHNLKVSLKGKILKKDFSDLFSELGKYNAKNLNEHILNEDYDYFDLDIREDIKDAINIFNESKDPQSLDIKMDKGLFKSLLNISKNLKSDLAIDMTRYSIDFTNFKTLLRIKRQMKNIKFFQNAIIDGGLINYEILSNMYLDSLDGLSKYYTSYKHRNVFVEGLKSYIENNNFSYFEKLSDDFILNITKSFKYSAFGMEPIIAFLNAKENEIKILRIILAYKLNNISPDSIKERLRDVYV